MSFSTVESGHWDTEEGRAMAERYAKLERATLLHGDLTDMELANRIYMAGRNDLELPAWQQAAKDRIRWLSAKLAEANAALRDTAENGRWHGPEVAKTWPEGSLVLRCYAGRLLAENYFRPDWVDRHFSGSRFMLIAPPN